MRRIAGIFRASLIVAATVLAGATCADELVTFDSARYLVGSLQQKLARERGEPVQRAPAEKIEGYLSKPEGSGPFPAVVHLHGCGGLSMRARKAAAEQFTKWGYVTLAVDSFSPRGIDQACTAMPTAPRQADALGALVYLSKLPFVDPKRIAVVGYSQGGMAALQAASFRQVELFEMPAGLTFKAAVAYYPQCDTAEDRMAVPTLVLIGELDDWSPIRLCEWWMQRRNGQGAPVKLVVYPEAFHGFDNPGIHNGMDFTFGHWLKYDPEAAARSQGEMRDFLADRLSN